MEEFQDEERTGLNQLIHTVILMVWSFNKYRSIKRKLKITNMRKDCINKWQKIRKKKKAAWPQKPCGGQKDPVESMMNLPLTFLRRLQYSKKHPSSSLLFEMLFSY